MSSYPTSVPSGLTRGYSNSFTDMLVRLRYPIEQEVSLTNSDLDILDNQQVDGGR
jgi:hypothetical protein